MPKSKIILLSAMIWVGTTMQCLISNGQKEEFGINIPKKRMSGLLINNFH